MGKSGALGLVGIYYVSAPVKRAESKEVGWGETKPSLSLKKNRERKEPQFLSRRGTWGARRRDL